MLVGDVVGELELVEGDDFLHPLLSGRGAVRVDVHPLRHLWVGLAGNHPSAEGRRERENVRPSHLGDNHMLSHVAASRPPPHSPIVKLVSVVICGDDVEEQDVFRLLVQAGHLKLEVWKHLAARGEKERDHH